MGRVDKFLTETFDSRRDSFIAPVAAFENRIADDGLNRILATLFHCKLIVAEGEFEKRVEELNRVATLFLERLGEIVNTKLRTRRSAYARKRPVDFTARATRGKSFGLCRARGAGRLLECPRRIDRG